MTGSSDHISGALPPKKYGPLKQPEGKKGPTEGENTSPGVDRRPPRPSDQVTLRDAQGADVLPSADPEISPEDLERYTKLLKEMPDIREDILKDVEGRLEDGYGREALDGTIDGLLADGVL